jgi:hypothetical protein
VTELAPNVKFYHNDSHIKSAGGTFGDSKAGTKDAGEKNYHRIDNNGDGVLYKGKLYPVNAHGKPFLPSYIKDRFTMHKWGPLHLKHPSLRNARKTFRHAKKFLGKNAVVEWEVKDLHPYTSKARLDEYFEQLKLDALAIWEDDWQKHVVVKCLTNLAGGIKYCKHVLKAAHRAGFDTMILPRGEHVHQVINKPYITWNRGGKVA